VLTLAAVAVPLGAAAARATPAAPAAPAPAAWGPPTALPSGAPHSRPLIRAARAGASAAALSVATSSNWSGYVAQGGPFTSISGQWTVPTVQPSSAQVSSGTWIGIDGVASSSLIQTGTGQDSSGGVTDYYAWFEVLPAPAQYIGAVTPGDVMSASITETGVNTNEWTVSIQDLTSHQIVSPSGTYYTPGQSADWIEEAPTGSSGLLTLANYGTVTFTHLAVGINGQAPSAPTNLQPVAMIDAGHNVISQPGPYDPAANTFSVSYVAGSPSTTTTTTPTPTTTPPVACSPSTDHRLSGQAVAIAAMRSASGCEGYWVVSAEGQVGAFGAAQAYGDLSSVAHAPVVAIIASPTGLGYWLATADGLVRGYGDAVAVGDLGGRHLNGRIIAMAPTADAKGYWLVGSDGGIFTFGDAAFFGSTGATHLNQPVVGIAPAAGGTGYWLVASDGGVFAFGSASFLGSMGATHLNRPVVALTTDPLGRGYRMVGADGGIFSFGAPFYGSLGSSPPAAGVRTMAPSSDGNGYYLLGGDGAVYAFGDATYLGRA